MHGLTDRFLPVHRMLVASRRCAVKALITHRVNGVDTLATSTSSVSSISSFVYRPCSSSFFCASACSPPHHRNQKKPQNVTDLLFSFLPPSNRTKSSASFYDDLSLSAAANTHLTIPTCLHHYYIRLHSPCLIAVVFLRSLSVMSRHLNKEWSTCILPLYYFFAFPGFHTACVCCAPTDAAPTPRQFVRICIGGYDQPLE